MKIFRIALPVLAVALMAAPAAMADSYTYTITGSNFSATLNLTATANDANGIYVSGTDTITSVAGTFDVNGKTYVINTPIAPVLASLGNCHRYCAGSAAGIAGRLLRLYLGREAAAVGPLSTEERDRGSFEGQTYGMRNGGELMRWRVPSDDGRRTASEAVRSTLRLTLSLFTGLRPSSVLLSRLR